MMSTMQENTPSPVIRITEVGPRDGLQNENAHVSIGTKVKFINALSASGVSEIEVGAFVSPKAIPQMKDTDEVFCQILRTEGVTYTALVANERGLEQALTAGVDKIAVFTAASNTFNQHNIHATITESIARLRPVVSRARQTKLKIRGYISMVAFCPYEGRISPEAVMTVMHQLQDIGVEEIALGETLGKASPHDMRPLLDKVCAEWPVSQVGLHLHDTYGLAIANALMAWDQFGITHFDGSAGGLGGCPYASGASGNVATENLVRAFKAHNAHIAVNEKKLIEAVGMIAKDLGRSLSSQFSSSPPADIPRPTLAEFDSNLPQGAGRQPSLREKDLNKNVSLWNQVKSGNLRAVSRLISLAESNLPQTIELINQHESSTGRTSVIGITGYPGAGKSTLINRLVAAYRTEGKKVGILAVDTSSPFSGGAILGDRIRMHDHSLDELFLIHGNVATENLVRAFKAHNAHIAVNEKKLIEAVGMIAKDLGRSLSSQFSSSPPADIPRPTLAEFDSNLPQGAGRQPSLREKDLNKNVSLWNQVKSGNLRAVSRLISLAESNLPQTIELINQHESSTGRTSVIGITGYPGAGKSTLINRLVAAYRTEGKKVGILAVDTSSPFSGGAILGDRIRMHDHSLDEHVYIRSMATRGNRGGLAQATGYALKVLEAAGFDVVLIETVGMGQEEGEIARLVQTVVVVVAPGLGDEIQAMKAGLLEIAHLVVVNKADRDGAGATIHDLKDWVPQVVMTVALKGEGIGSVMEAIATHQQKTQIPVMPMFESLAGGEGMRRS